VTAGFAKVLQHRLYKTIKTNLARGEKKKMLQGVLGKVMSGLLSASALLFSPTAGNQPQFEPLHCRAGQNYLQVSAVMNNAFQNDFEDVFCCGKHVTLVYKVEIRSNGASVYTNQYRHRILYDPMNAAWECYKSETNLKEMHSSYQTLLDDISRLECSIPREAGWKTVDIRGEAWLLPIELSRPHRTVDLMMLWKFKRPAAHATMNLPPTS
jgi:hypothetical protein